MARKLVFEFNGEAVAFEMIKVDRSRLYGFKELEVHDENGQTCELATLADNGKTLIGKGGTGVGYVTADGNWSNKEELKAVNVEGEEIVPVPSSFAAPISLSDQTTMEDYLNHNIRLTYQLGNDGIPDELYKSLVDGAIYGFEYSYRGGLVADRGFVMMNDANEIFFLVGDDTHVEYLGLQQTAPTVAEDLDSEETAADLMDFDMI